jgi:predicted amidohydrolase YtcJ
MSHFDLLFQNGPIITMDGDLSRKRWVAVNGGQIAAVGDTDSFTGEASVVVDLAGRTVLPGLTDTHAHSSMTAIGQKGVDLSGVDSVGGIVERIGDFCTSHPGDAPVFGCNLAMAEQIKEGRLPNRYELDEVSGAHPVMLVLWTVHGGVLNSKAIAPAQLEEDMTFVEKDGIFNDDRTSFHIIGHLYGTMKDEDFRANYFDIANQCAAKGITTIHSLDGMMVKDDRDTDVLKDILDELPIEFIPYTQTFDYEKIHGYGFKQIGGCLSLDGSPPQLTAAYSSPYPVAPHTRGFLNYTDLELYEFVSAVTKLGMQVGFHAIGDRAIDQILYIYQQVDREIGIRDLRHRIEHFSTPSDRHLEMAAELNLIATAQPEIGNMLDNVNGNAFEAFAPPQIAAYHENFARVIRAGVTVSGGSDSPVTPMDCFVGIDACVNAYNPDRRVSLDEALKLYTVNAAYAAHQEDIKGSIEVGKQADLIIIDKDPYQETGPINRSVITVEETWKKGKCVFKKN